MESYSFKIESSQEVEFLIDNDSDFSWLSQCDTKSHNRIYVVVDTFIDDKWGTVLRKKLNKQDKEVIWLTFQSVEENKSLENFVELVNKLEARGLNRYDVIIAIGSGVLLDLVGFVASTYMRGVPLILVPTTLIGQVDAATAGKTCVNSTNSKNLVGTLYLPRQVYNNVHFLRTLSGYHFRQGVSEIFKYGLLGSKRLIKLLLDHKKEPSDNTLIQIINETIRVRMKLRKEDPLASNLGHTFGHAMEKLSDYSVGHGDAISAGILMAVCLGEREGITRSGTLEKVLHYMEQLSINRYYDTGWAIDDIVGLMLKDKKSSSDRINLVMIKDIGEPYSRNSLPFFSVEKEIVRTFLQYFFSKHTGHAKSGLAQFLKQQEKI